MTSIDLVITILGIPSGPGALYGLSASACRFICSREIWGRGAISSGYPAKVGSGGGGGGFCGKNESAKILHFSTLESTMVSWLEEFVWHSDGMRERPPSDGV